MASSITFNSSPSIFRSVSYYLWFLLRSKSKYNNRTSKSQICHRNLLSLKMESKMRCLAMRVRRSMMNQRGSMKRRRGSMKRRRSRSLSRNSNNKGRETTRRIPKPQNIFLRKKATTRRSKRTNKRNEVCFSPLICFPFLFPKSLPSAQICILLKFLHYMQHQQQYNSFVLLP